MGSQGLKNSLTLAMESSGTLAMFKQELREDLSSGCSVLHVCCKLADLASHEIATRIGF
jgi:hypothetical protein